MQSGFLSPSLHPRIHSWQSPQLLWAMWWIYQAMRVVKKALMRLIFWALKRVTLTSEPRACLHSGAASLFQIMTLGGVHERFKKSLVFVLKDLHEDPFLMGFLLFALQLRQQNNCVGDPKCSKPTFPARPPCHQFNSFCCCSFSFFFPIWNIYFHVT